ncbi:hypothetical protein [Thermosynechococcus sp.]|uniref:urease accessory protein UreE N-terminal domain-containing protein n=1 Tax=Thermosynechococcus sp. TaxID=2814275 RepID=UPI00391D7428
MLTLTQLCPTILENARQLHLSLTAEERCRSRLHCHSDEGESLYLKLPRGIILQPGDRLRGTSRSSNRHSGFLSPN